MECGCSRASRRAARREAELELGTGDSEIAPIVPRIKGKPFDTEPRSQLDDRRPVQDHRRPSSEHHPTLGRQRAWRRRLKHNEAHADSALERTQHPFEVHRRPSWLAIVRQEEIGHGHEAKPASIARTPRRESRSRDAHLAAYERAEQAVDLPERSLWLAEFHYGGYGDLASGCGIGSASRRAAAPYPLQLLPRVHVAW